MDQTERDFLRGVFLMEAWDTLATLEDRAPALATGGDLDELHVVAHRLRGAAALHGFAHISALAAQIEEVVDLAMVQSPADRRRGALNLGELIAELKQALDGAGSGIATGGLTEGEADVHVAPAPADDVGTYGTPIESETSGRAAALSRFFTDNPEILEYFLPEAAEHLEAMAASLQTLERTGRDEREVAQLFRAVHTLKGAAYTVGCHPVGALAHRAEDLLVAIRDSSHPVTPTIIEALFATHEAVRAMLGSSDAGSPMDEVVDAAHRALEAVGIVGADESHALAVEAPIDVPVVARPQPSIQAPSAGDAVGAPRRQPGGSIRVALDRLDTLMKSTGELVSARTRLEQHLTRLEHVDELLRFTGERMGHVVGEFERKYLDPRPMAAALPEPSSPSTSDDELFGELEFDRYDDFNALARSVGELSTDVGEIRARLGAVLRGVRQEMAQVQRLGTDLRSQVSRARMVPMSRLFGRLPRQLQEVARAAGRDVEFLVQGEAVELDTSLVEQLTDPMLHLLRNAVVHGIEPAAERQLGGKPDRGTITLRASQRGGAIRLELADDGRGIDVDAVRREAVRRGLVAADVVARLAPREALDLVFLPGLSTAPELSTVAGRGVGMDVVRTNVARLGGSVEVESRPGAGTTFTITLPLTLAIAEVLVVRVGREVMAVPVTAVKAIAVADGVADASGGDDRVVLDDGAVRLVNVGEVLGIGRPDPPGRRVALVLGRGQQGLAIAVDELLRKEEVVVKALGRFLEPLPVYAGATISQDGHVVLVLDPSRLMTFVAQGGRGHGPDGTPEIPAPVARERWVLLVDDSVSVRRFVGQMLERAGLRVVTANDGADAQERLRARSFDAVVTDLEMPKVDGYELIRDLRRRPVMRDVPIVVLTTRAGDKHVEMARRLGVTHYVTKPVDEESFVALVAALMAVGEPSPSGAAR